ncbi:hypothetical protein [Nostoc sp. CALU 546]
METILIVSVIGILGKFGFALVKAQVLEEQKEKDTQASKEK